MMKLPGVVLFYGKMTYRDQAVRQLGIEWVTFDVRWDVFKPTTKMSPSYGIAFEQEALEIALVRLQGIVRPLEASFFAT